MSGRPCLEATRLARRVLHPPCGPERVADRYFFIYQTPEEPDGLSPWRYQTASGVEPPRGSIYLRSSGATLPDLVADLRSDAIRIILEGRIGPGRKGGREGLLLRPPRPPLSRFVMKLHGGRRGLLLNSANTCRRPPVATGKAIGQNDSAAYFLVKLRGQCAGRKTRKVRWKAR